MRRICLDTNCLLMALPSRSPYHKVWTDFLGNSIAEYIVSNDSHFKVLNDIDFPVVALKTLKEFVEELERA